MTMFSVAITLASSRKTFAPRTLVGAHVVRVAGLDLDAQLREAVDVRVEPAPADDVAARRRDDRGSRANEQRPGEQERRAHLRAEVAVELRLANVGGVDADVVRADPLDVGAEVVDQREHRVDVPDARDVVQRRPARLVITHAARIGSTPFLLPAAVTRPWRGWPPSITNDSVTALATTVSAMGEGLSYRASWRSLATAPGRP